MISAFYYDSPVGKILIGDDDGAICLLLFEHSPLPFEYEIKESSLTKKAKKQLDEYFSGKRKLFDLPLNLRGTDFQRSVWSKLTEIPYGETRSYGDIAKAIDNPLASRAVGMANNKNPISIIVPCHRVIGANGSLTGYGGGLDAKTYLLKLENKYK